MNWVKVAALTVYAFSKITLAAESGSAAALPPDIESLVTESLSAAEYVETTRCIHRPSPGHIVILSNEYLLFTGRDNRVWLNRLQQRCIGLRRNMILEPTIASARICQSDRLVARNVGERELRRGRFQSFGPNAPETKCTLGEFESIDPQQAVALRAQLATTK